MIILELYYENTVILKGENCCVHHVSTEGSSYTRLKIASDRIIGSILFFHRVSKTEQAILQHVFLMKIIHDTIGTQVKSKRGLLF